MTRLIILWRRPYHLTAGEAEDWTRREVGRLSRLEGVGHAELTRLRSASAAHPREWDWMLEFRLEPSTNEQDLVEVDEIAEWVGDLRLLGMRPSLIVAGDGIVLRREGC